MECRHFRDIAAELARSQARGVALDHEAVAHARQCGDCATLLAGEARLAASLNALREKDKQLQAPPYLENTLLEEFRALNRPGPAAPAPRRVHRNWWVLAATAAALVLAVWPGLWRQPVPPEGGIALSIPATTDIPVMPGSAPAGTSESAEPGPDPTPPHPTLPHPTPRAAPAPAPAAGSQAPSAKPSSEPPRPQPLVTRAQAAVEPASETSAEPLAEPAAETAAADRNQEFVTEFVPLTYAAWTPAALEARLVRVRLPSTALLYFGLPATAGTASVEADVVLGEDGLAHAVRFVRPAMASTDLADRSSRTPQAY